jgi:hypothetical protein
VSKRKRSSQSQAAIIASLELAQEYARIIAAASINYNEDIDQPDTDGQWITESTQSVVTQ